MQRQKVPLPKECWLSDGFAADLLAHTPEALTEAHEQMLRDAFASGSPRDRLRVLAETFLRLDRSRKEYLDENPAERFRSVFQLTEEQAAAEAA